MHKYLLSYAIIYFVSVAFIYVHARGENSEFRLDVPMQTSGNNVRRASSENTKSFSGSG